MLKLPENLPFTAESRADFPAVGDRPALSVFENGVSIIHKILPRFSVFSRLAVGKFSEKQIISTNIDYSFLAQAIDRDFKINRFESCLTICHYSNVKPIVLLTKIDLTIEQKVTEIVNIVKKLIENVPVIPISNELVGVDELTSIIEKGKTYCFIGSSGVGKSSLINNFLAKQ